jgi:hypothetical protein
VAVSDLFAPDARPRTEASLLNALGIGVLVVGTLIALVVVFSGGPAGNSRGNVGARAGTPVDMADPLAPLELTALGHERTGDDLSIRGVVTNPAGRGPVGPITAQVSVFNRAGELVATARAPIERNPLAGGVESRFVVRVTGVGDVDRYRVSFSVDNRTVAHVDRRDHTVTAQLP